MHSVSLRSSEQAARRWGVGGHLRHFCEAFKFFSALRQSLVVELVETHAHLVVATKGSVETHLGVFHWAFDILYQ